MRIGLILPTFAESFDLTIRALDDLEEAGLDGGFVYDHLWPMHHREDPAISAYVALGALAARRSSATLGTLVARVANVSPNNLVRELRSLFEVAEGSFIAGIGTADIKSAEEYLGYGLVFPSARARRQELQTVAQELLTAGVPVWIGGGAPATNAIARELGATVNLWGATPERVRLAAMYGPVSWAGKLPAELFAAARVLADLEAAGSTWAIFSWPTSMALLLRAIELAKEL
jgi:alkanesulfonate monooxygenase SsuD/methylene tetrahydromethanopterin reductase-like flavin-dependent oxidoreductase (luciferase family)